MKAIKQFRGSTSDSFEVETGGNQVCVLASTLFGIYFAAILNWAFKDVSADVSICMMLDGSLFNFLKARF